MKKILKIVTIIILLILPLTVFGKVPRQFNSIINNDVHNQVEICLYSDGKYEIIISLSESGELIETFTVTSGNYKFQKSNLKLYDIYNNFNMKFIYQKGYLVAEKAFIGFKEFAFEEIELTDYTNHQSYSEEIPNKLLRTRSDYKKKNKILYGLEYGKYIGQGSLSSFMFDINSNQSFELKVKDLTLLSGTWERVGNELRLYDTTLKHTFFVFIAKKKLINYIFNEQIGVKYLKVINFKK